MSDKTINLKPFHCEMAPDGGAFVMEFYCATEGNKRVKVRLRMEFWWIGFIARELWKMIARRQQEVDDAKKALSNAP